MFFGCFAAFVLLAPLYKAGNRPIPLLLLEFAAIGFLFATFALHRAPLLLPRTLQIAVVVLLVYPLVQLLPLPEALWRALPGHAEYASVLERFAAREAAWSWRALSVVPTATQYGWLALLPPLACLVGTLRLATDQVARLLLLMVILAGGESMLGLLQIAPGGGGALYFGNEEPGQYAAIGTFVNRNHLAAMFAMVLPVIVGLLMYSLRPGLRRLRRPGRTLASEAMARRVLLFASAVLILVCLVFTRSRAGTGTALVGLLCSGIVLVRARASSMGARRTRIALYIVAGLVAIAAVVALVIGVGPVLQGLASGQLQGSAEFRTAIYVASLRAAVVFLPFGSGLSTFADIFPRFQLADVGGYIDYAHNDYLQALVEMGLAAPVIVGLLLVAYVVRMHALLHAEGGRSFTLLQIGAGLGMLPMILHSTFDFALHMPSNAMWFATLAGVVFHPMVGPRDHFEGERHKIRPDTLPVAVVPPKQLPPPLPGEMP